MSLNANLQTMAKREVPKRNPDRQSPDRENPPQDPEPVEADRNMPDRLPYPGHEGVGAIPSFDDLIHPPDPPHEKS
jgi:hypothetical protein